MTDAENPDFDLCLREIGNWVSRRTYVLLDVSSGAEGASAVPVRIGQRYFFATAGHVLSCGSPLHVLTEHRHVSLPESKRNYVKSGKEHDYGYVELVPSELIPVDHWLDLEDLQPTIDFAHTAHVVVSGWPTEWYSAAGRAEKIAHVNCAWSVLRPPRDWPEADVLGYKPAPEEHVYVEYPGEEATLTMTPSDINADAWSVQSEPVYPVGMSGGGIWLVPEPGGSSSVWRPHASLIGIQASLLSVNRLLHGNRIGLWLDLVAGDYPDVHDEITAIRAS